MDQLPGRPGSYGGNSAPYNRLSYSQRRNKEKNTSKEAHDWVQNLLLNTLETQYAQLQQTENFSQLKPLITNMYNTIRQWKTLSDQNKLGQAYVFQNHQ